MDTNSYNILHTTQKTFYVPARSQTITLRSSNS